MELDKITSLINGFSNSYGGYTRNLSGTEKRAIGLFLAPIINELDDYDTDRLLEDLSEEKREYIGNELSSELDRSQVQELFKEFEHSKSTLFDLFMFNSSDDDIDVQETKQLIKFITSGLMEHEKENLCKLIMNND